MNDRDQLHQISILTDTLVATAKRHLDEQARLVSLGNEIAAWGVRSIFLPSGSFW
jgi:hypothetical protein